MTFHEFYEGRAMVVMDERRRVAIARPFGSGSNRGWQLAIAGGCWIGARNRRAHNMLVVKTRAEAKKILQSLIL